MIQTRIKPSLPIDAVIAIDMARVEAEQINALAQIATELFHDFRISVTKSGLVDAKAADWNQIAALLSVIEDKAVALGKACDSSAIEATLNPA